MNTTLKIAFMLLMIVPMLPYAGTTRAVDLQEGTHWTKYQGNPVIASPYFDQPSIIYEAGVYKMWVSAIAGQGLPLKIYYAVSTDGISWTTPYLVLDAGTSGSWDDYCVRAPSVISLGTEYRMWYLGSRNDGIYEIGLATSPDGIVWTKNESNPVMVPGANGGWDN